MKILIVEDDFASRRVIKNILAPYGDCDVVVDGEEAIQAFRMAHEDGDPYDLICLDIMLPQTDGLAALTRMRDLEKEWGVQGSKETKVLMVTALDDPKTVFKSYYRAGATAYIVKPVEKEQLLDKIRSLGLMRQPARRGSE